MASRGPVRHGEQSWSSEALWLMHTHAQAVCFKLTYSCLCSHAFAGSVSALYVLCVKLLMWVIRAILCFNESLRVQFDVWVVIISTHYVWLAILMQDRDTERERAAQTKGKSNCENVSFVWPLLLLLLHGHEIRPFQSENRGDQGDRNKGHIHWWWNNNAKTAV